jgi:putative oxidoreductase
MVGLVKSITLLVGRLLIAGVFLYESTVLVGLGWEGGYRYVEGGGLPGWVWWLVLALNGIGGAMIAIGLCTRWVAAAFAVFCASAAILFHNRLTVPNEVLHFGKDLGLAGGFLFLVVTGAGALSADAILRRRLGLE